MRVMLSQRPWSGTLHGRDDKCNMDVDVLIISESNSATVFNTFTPCYVCLVMSHVTMLLFDASHIVRVCSRMSQVTMLLFHASHIVTVCSRMSHVTMLLFDASHIVTVCSLTSLLIDRKQCLLQTKVGSSKPGNNGAVTGSRCRQSASNLDRTFNGWSVSFCIICELLLVVCNDM